MQANKPLLLVVSLFVLFTAAQAQTGRKKARTATKKATTVKTKTTVQNSNIAVLPAMNIPADTIPVKQPVISMEADYITGGNPVKPSMVLAYEPISEDDVAWRQRVWRDIDVREKINLPFAYTAEEDNGNQQFIYVLLNALRNDPAVKAYNAIDDRFTTPLKRSELSDILVDKPEIVRVPDWKKDPTGNTFKDSIIRHDFNPARISRYRIKEDWVFDKKTSRLVVRILGIAPIEEINLQGEVIDKPLFWLYYPKLRNTLAGYEVYNAKNHGARPTWEQVFESRMFNSYIVKSTMDNPRDLYLRDMPALKDNKLLQLWEGENIKNKIFDYEQNLWSH